MCFFECVLFIMADAILYNAKMSKYCQVNQFKFNLVKISHEKFPS